MKIHIPYGEEKIPIEIPDLHRIEILEPQSVPRKDLGLLMKEALSHPEGLLPFEEFIRDARSLLIIVNDATRPTPTADMLDHLREYFKGKKVAFLIATGAHRAPTEDELEQIFGRHLPHVREHIIVHDAEKKEDLRHFGKTSFGTEVYFNKAITEYDVIVPITSVEPHYFAGYTGGRKSFNPGVAGKETITSNHKLALSPKSGALQLEGNPVHDDMIESAKMIPGNIFSILTVLDRDHHVYAVESGEIFASLPRAVRKAEEVFCQPIKGRADVVITVAGHPSDIDLYQSQKAVDNAKGALKEGGVMILVSKCRKGTGSDSFIKLMAQTKSPRETIAKIDEGYKLGYHKAAKMAEIMLCGQIWAVTDLEPEIMDSIFIKPYKTLDEAVKSALHEKGEHATVCVLMDGSLVVPKLVEQAVKG